MPVRSRVDAIAFTRTLTTALCALRSQYHAKALICRHEPGSEQITLAADARVAMGI